MKVCQHCGQSFKGRISREHKVKCDGWENPPPLMCLCGFHTESQREDKAHKKTCSVWQGRDKEAIKQMRRKQNARRKYGTDSPVSKSALAQQGVKSGREGFDTSTVIERFKAKHGDAYDYSNVVYVNAHTKVEITCLAHDHTFKQKARDHWDGSGCPLCARESISISRVLSFDEWEARCRGTHGAIYDYSKIVLWRGVNDKVVIGCKTCGEDFEQRANSHYQHGCPKCGQKQRDISCTKTHAQFLSEAEKIHGSDKYEYLSEYNHSKEKMSIRCVPCDYVFEQESGEHTRGSGCPNCCKGKSERLFGECLVELLPDVEIWDARKYGWLMNPSTGYPLELDFYIPSMKIAFEVQGRQHYEEIEKWGGSDKLSSQQHRDTLKRTLCEARGIVLYEYDLREGRDKSSMGLWLKGVL